MQEQSNSVYKTLTWLLLLVVIGLYALHQWYSGTLKESLAGQQTKIAEGARSLTDSNAKLAAAAQTEKELRGEIQGLTRKVETGDQANLALQGDMDALKQHDAEVLAAEQRKAADAYGNLQGRFDATNRQIATLGAEIEGLKQAAVDAAAQHQSQLAAAEQQSLAKVQSVEDKLNERIDHLRTTLEGSDPERAALFADFDQRIQADLVTIAGLKTTQAELTDQLAAAKQAIEEKVRALTEVGQRLEATQGELTQARGELAQLQAQYDAAMDKATMHLAALQAKHDAAVDKAAQERAALEAQHTAALDRAAKDRADLEAAHAAAMDQAAKAHADTRAAHAAAIDQAAKEHADLEAAHAASMDQAAKDTAALKAGLEGDLAQAKAAHGEEIGQANSRIETLTTSLAAETAALAALRAKHDNLVAELNGKLAEAERTLAGVRSDLNTAQQAAAEQKAALEQQIAEAQGRITGLEETIATERQQAEAARLAAEQAHRDAMSYQHDLFARFSEIGATETEQGMFLRIQETEMQFPVSKATLPKGELPSLDRIARLMADYPRLSARIEGHTDASGREETNLALSQARADAVKQALVDRGVAAKRLEAIGIGEARPIGDNKTKAGSRQNRRVEVYLVEAQR
jgi:outer membrane protein OmpA-like peptidoglycan-associated protein